MFKFLETFGDAEEGTEESYTASTVSGYACDDMGNVIQKGNGDNHVTMLKGNVSTEIGELGKNVDISRFFGKIMGAHATEATNLTLLQWTNKVRGGGDWDLKDNSKTIFGVAWAFDKEAIKSNPDAQKTSFSFGNTDFKNAADVGNYHAGYTGTYAGISYNAQWKGAGMAEMLKNREFGKMLDPKTQLIAPYGDKLTDYKWNTRGMDAAAREMHVKGPDLTVARQIDDE